MRLGHHVDVKSGNYLLNGTFEFRDLVLSVAGPGHGFGDSRGLEALLEFGCYRYFVAHSQSISCVPPQPPPILKFSPVLTLLI